MNKRHVVTHPQIPCFCRIERRISWFTTVGHRSLSAASRTQSSSDGYSQCMIKTRTNNTICLIANSIASLEGAWSSPACPSDKGSIKIKISMEHWWNDNDRGNGSRRTGEKRVAVPLRGATFVIITVQSEGRTHSVLNDVTSIRQKVSNVTLTPKTRQTAAFFR